MRVTGAVLRELPVPQPYATTRPLDVVTLELDDPGPGEVLVRIESAGLCHSDLSVVDGNRPRPVPMLLGHEAAGTVEAVGTGVLDVQPGERVVLVYVPSCGVCRFCSGGRPALCPTGAGANGRGDLVRGGTRLHEQADSGPTEVRHHLGVSGFATHAVVDRTSVVVVDDVPPEIAALFGCAMLTGFGAVTHTGDVRPGESVAVFGLGGVGQAVVMSAAAAGAQPIIGIDPVASKRQLARDLGATHVGAPDDLADLLADAAPGGVDWAFEVVGSARVLEQAYGATGRGGATVAVGLPHPEATFTLPALGLIADNKRILGSYMGTAQPQVDVPAMVRLWKAGRLPVDRLATGTIGFDGLNAALDALADGSAVRQVLLPHGPTA